MLRWSRLLVVATIIGLAGGASWSVSPRPERPSHFGGTDASAVSAEGPEAVLVASPRQAGSESPAPRPSTIGLAFTATSLALGVAGVLARRTRRHPQRTPRWIACGVRAPPALHFV